MASYTPYGPFQNGGSPGLSAQFFNALEAFLVSVNSAATDSNISSNGNGVLTITKLGVTTGSLSRLAIIGGVGTATINHGWGVQPDGVQVTYAGNYGSPPTSILAWYQIDNNNLKVVAQSGVSWSALLLKA